ncbi:MAG: hypothetical protein EA412_03865 [Chitinophagaceae bacterium]|nr:MAG: hypothetical protein EA412_03865 [Chitinophagaceae bacterium]
MIENLYNFIDRTSSKTVLIFGIVIIFIINLLVFPYFSTLFPENNFSEKYILDLRFSYDAATVLYNFEMLGAIGRNVYFWLILVFDVPYAFVYGYVYAALIIILYKNYKPKAAKILFIFPIIMMFSDTIENIGIITMLTTYPKINETGSGIFSFFTSLKWLSTIPTFPAIIWGVIMKYVFKK